MMLFLHYYYNSWQYFFLKSSVCNVHQFPFIKNLVLHIQLTKSSFSALCAGLLLLEMLTVHRPQVLLSNKANLILKIRKGLPVGCKVHLGRVSVFNFLENFWVFLVSRVDGADLFTGSATASNVSTTLNISVSDVFAFKELEGCYFECREYLSRLQVHINFCGSYDHVKIVAQALKLSL